MNHLNLPTIIVEHSVSLQNKDYKELSKHVRTHHKAVLVIKAFNDNIVTQNNGNIIQQSLNTFNISEKKCIVSIKASRGSKMPVSKEIEEEIKNLLL